MEFDDQNNQSLVTEALISRINTRETSTLAFVAVTGSASLVFFALVLQPGFPNGPQWEWVKWIGLLFSLLGLAYREATVFTSDRIDYQKLKDRLNEPLPEPPGFWIVFRAAIILFFLFLPITAWWVLLNDNKCSSTILASASVISVLLAALEFSLRQRPTPKAVSKTSAQLVPRQEGAGSGNQTPTNGDSLLAFYSHTSRVWNSAVTLTLGSAAFCVSILSTQLFSLLTIDMRFILAFILYGAVIYGFFRIAEISLQLEFLESRIQTNGTTLLQFINQNVPRWGGTHTRRTQEQIEELRRNNWRPLRSWLCRQHTTAIIGWTLIFAILMSRLFSWI